MKTKRQYTKIYPSQIQLFNKQQYSLYNPMQFWVETHSLQSLNQMISLPQNTSKFNMFTFNNQLFIQSETSVYKLSQILDQKQFIKLIESKQIFKTNIQTIGEYFVGITDMKKLKFWNANSSNYMYLSNPQQTKSYKQKQFYYPFESFLQSHQINSLTSLCHHNTSLLCLHKFHNNQVSIIESKITDSSLQFSQYPYILPQNIQKLYSLNNNIYAIGGQNLLFIDQRSKRLAANINQDNGNIKIMKNSTQNKWKYYFSTNNQIKQIDIRNLQSTILFEAPSLISDFVINQNNCLTQIVLSCDNGRVIFTQ